MIQHGFPKTNRLLNGGDFRSVFDQVAVKAATAHFLLLASPADTDEPRKIGFIISKKNIKHAVHRNRVKRIVREQFRHLPQDYPNLKIVFLARKGCGQLANDELHHLSSKMLKKLSYRWQEATKGESA